MIEEGDRQTYREVCAGNPDAGRLLVQSYNPGLMVIARGMGLRDEFALDVTQMVWLRFFEHASAVQQGTGEPLRDPGAVRAWLATTCRNLAYDEYRRRKSESNAVQRKFSDDEALGALVDESEPGERLFALERDAAVRSAMLKLTERCQELLALLVAEPRLSYEEIGEIIGRPVGSIGPTRDRCLSRLRSLLMGEGHE